MFGGACYYADAAQLFAEQLQGVTPWCLWRTRLRQLLEHAIVLRSLAHISFPWSPGACVGSYVGLQAVILTADRWMSCMCSQKDHTAHSLRAGVLGLLVARD